jgi:hypothetical protein
MIKHFIFPSIAWLIKLFLLLCCVSLITVQHIETTKIWIPLRGPVEDQKITMIKEDLKKLGAPERNLNSYSKSIKIASEASNIDDRILTTVICKESTFKINAKSKKGYKGLMQTRIASMEHPEVDIMMGAKELQKWILHRKGNMEYALASYNGGNKPPKESWDYANKVIKIAQSL